MKDFSPWLYQCKSSPFPWRPYPTTWDHVWNRFDSTLPDDHCKFQSCHVFERKIFIDFSLLIPVYRCTPLWLDLTPRFMFLTNLNLHYLWMLSHKISGYWFLRRELWYIAIKLPPFRFIHSPCDGNFNKLESTLPENSSSSISIPDNLNFEKTILIILKLLPKESQFWTNVWNDEQEI